MKTVLFLICISVTVISITSFDLIPAAKREAWIGKVNIKLAEIRPSLELPSIGPLKRKGYTVNGNLNGNKMMTLNMFVRDNDKGFRPLGTETMEIHTSERKGITEHYTKMPKKPYGKDRMAVHSGFNPYGISGQKTGTETDITKSIAYLGEKRNNIGLECTPEDPYVRYVVTDGREDLYITPYFDGVPDEKPCGITFHDALTTIAVRVHTQDLTESDAKITLKEISIAGINTRGNLSFEKDSLLWERQTGPADFTIFEGSMPLDSLKPLMSTYIYMIPQELPEDASLIVLQETRVEDRPAETYIESLPINEWYDQTGDWLPGKTIIYDLMIEYDAEYNATYVYPILN